MSKKIEPTDAMVQEAEFTRRLWGPDVRAILYTALNHPDAPGLFMDEDDRPWEPLNGPVRVGDGVRQDAPGLFADADDRPWEPLNEGTLLCRGDEVRRELGCITTTAAVARVDEVDALWTAEGMFIGRLDSGTWYVRRAVQELPEWTGAIIEGAGGGRIQATAEGVTYTAAEAIYRDGMWYGAWRTARGGTGIQFSSSSITPGTWKVGNR